MGRRSRQPTITRAPTGPRAAPAGRKSVVSTRRPRRRPQVPGTPPIHREVAVNGICNRLAVPVSSIASRLTDARRSAMTTLLDDSGTQVPPPLSGASRRPVSRRVLLLWMLMIPLTCARCKQRPAAEQQVVDLVIESDGDFLAFQPDTLSCPSGALVRLTFRHRGKFLSARHNWVLVYPGQMQ